MTSTRFQFGWIVTEIRIGSIGLSAIAFVLLSTFPGWHEEVDANGSEIDVKPFPSRPVSQAAFAASFISAIFAMISALWQHTSAATAASMIELSHYGFVAAHVGSVATGLVWLGFFLQVIVAIGLLVMILSIIILDKLTDD